MNTKVVIPTEKDTKFPDECVVCYQPNRNEFNLLTGAPVGMDGFLEWVFGESGAVLFSIHDTCSKSLKRKHFLKNLILLAVFTAIAISWYLLDAYEILLPFELNTVNFVITAVIICLPIFVIQDILLPTPFEFRVFEDKIEYMFENEEYAQKFKKLNNIENKVDVEDEPKEIGELKKNFDELSTEIDAMLLLEERKYNEAIEKYTQLIELNSKKYSTYRFRGEAFLRLKKFEEALSDLNKALQLFPNNDGALWLRSITYRKLGKYEEAKADRKLMKIIESKNEKKL